MRLAALLALVALPAAALGQTTADTRDDLLSVLGAALYPMAVMAYCHERVARDPDVLEAGRQWNERNGGLLATLEDRAMAAGVSDAARRAADAETLAEIEATVASQGDQRAYCRLVANVIEAGYYDIDRRADLEPALKRIFGVE